MGICSLFRAIRLDTKTLASIAIFGAFAIALEPIRMPLFFWPGQYLHFWEIPIIVAFFLFGFRVAFTVSIIEAVGYFALFPDGSGIVGIPWRIIVMSTMFLGLLIARKLGKQNDTINNIKQTGDKKNCFIHTLVPILTRATIMPIVDIAVYRFLLPLVIGHPIPDVYIMSLVPAFVFFNTIVPLYSVPIAYFTSVVVRKNLSLGGSYFIA